MASSSTQSLSRIGARLRENPWATASELAKDLRLAPGTVRQYLKELVREGRAERRNDATVPSPRGTGADRFNMLTVPLGPPLLTSDLLCDACVRKDYGDLLRYNRALSNPRDDWPDEDPEDEDEFMARVAALLCDRCQQPRY